MIVMLVSRNLKSLNISLYGIPIKVITLSLHKAQMFRRSFFKKKKNNLFLNLTN